MNTFFPEESNDVTASNWLLKVVFKNMRMGSLSLWNRDWGHCYIFNLGAPTPCRWMHTKHSALPKSLAQRGLEKAVERVRDSPWKSSIYFANLQPYVHCLCFKLTTIYLPSNSHHESFHWCQHCCRQLEAFHCKEQMSTLASDWLLWDASSSR